MSGRGAGPGDGHRGHGLGKGGEPDFTGDVGGVGIMHDGAVDEVVYGLATDAASVHEFTYREHPQVDRGQVLEDGSGSDEGCTGSCDDSGAFLLRVENKPDQPVLSATRRRGRNTGTKET